MMPPCRQPSFGKPQWGTLHGGLAFTATSAWLCVHAARMHAYACWARLNVDASMGISPWGHIRRQNTLLNEGPFPCCSLHMYGKGTDPCQNLL
eukprot:353248-Chlamydomonas_euryale.AAC.2